MFLPLLTLAATLAMGSQDLPLAPMAPPRDDRAPRSAVPTQTVQQAENPVNTPRKVCRSEAVTGSRFPIRVCRNAVQTDEDRAIAAEALRRLQGAHSLPTT